MKANTVIAYLQATFEFELCNLRVLRHYIWIVAKLQLCNGFRCGFTLKNPMRRPCSRLYTNQIHVTMGVILLRSHILHYEYTDTSFFVISYLILFICSRDMIHILHNMAIASDIMHMNILQNAINNWRHSELQAWRSPKRSRNFPRSRESRTNPVILLPVLFILISADWLQ